MKPSINWGKASALVALISLLVSIVALYVAFDGARTANRIASDALGTARQANQISMGVAREPAILEFVPLGRNEAEHDFRTPAVLKTELKTILTVKNVGKRSIDAIAFELIGVVGLTLQMSNPQAQFSSLPAYSTRLDLYAALQPGATAHIDIRKYILMYLAKLVPQLSDRTSDYRTVINVVLSPKASNETTPSPAGLGATRNDRLLIAVTFNSSVLQSAEAKKLLQSNAIAHRVYAN